MNASTSSCNDESSLVSEPFDLSDAPNMIKTRLRAGAGLRFKRKVLVNNDAEITNSPRGSQCAARQVKVLSAWLTFSSCCLLPSQMTSDLSALSFSR